MLNDPSALSRSERDKLRHDENYFGDATNGASGGNTIGAGSPSEMHSFALNSIELARLPPPPPQAIADDVKDSNATAGGGGGGGGNMYQNLPADASSLRPPVVRPDQFSLLFFFLENAL